MLSHQSLVKPSLAKYRFTKECFINHLTSCLHMAMHVGLLLLAMNASRGCELNNGFDMPEKTELLAFCSFSNGLAPAVYRPAQKYGAVNYEGEIIIPFEYDTPVHFWQGKALVQKGDKALIIDTKNKPIAQFDFQEVGNFESSGIAKFKQNGKWGFINADGDIIAEPQFDAIIMGFREDELDNVASIATFMIDNHYGAINQTGKIILPAEFDDIWIEKHLLKVEKSDKMGFYDLKGNLVQPIEFEPKNGFYSTTSSTQVQWLPLQKEGKMGAMNEFGRTIVPVEFDEVDLIGKNTFKVSKNGKYGLYRNNSLIHPMKYDLIGESSEFMIRVKYQGKWGYLQSNGALMTVDYDVAQDFFEGLAGVGRYREKVSQSQLNSQSTDTASTSWGYIDKTGAEVIPLQYDQITPFYDGLAPVKQDNKWGVIDFHGKVIIPFEYEGITKFDNGYAIVAKVFTQSNQQADLLDELAEKYVEERLYNLEHALPLGFSSENNSDFDKGKLTLKYGLVNRQGQLILETEYDEITKVSEGMIGVKKNNKWGFANQQGERLYPYQFDDIYPPFKNGDIQVNYCYDDAGDTIDCQSNHVISHIMTMDKHGNILSNLWSESTLSEVEYISDGADDDIADDSADEIDDDTLGADSDLFIDATEEAN